MADASQKIPDPLYQSIQIEFAYNSNRIEGNRLSSDQVREIYEINVIYPTSDVVNVDDIVETANHFRCVDLIINQANDRLSEQFIKELHRVLKSGTRDSRKRWFAVGEYKRLPNEIGGKETASPEEVPKAMKELLDSYNDIRIKLSMRLLSPTFALNKSIPSKMVMVGQGG